MRNLFIFIICITSLGLPGCLNKPKYEVKDCFYLKGAMASDSQYYKVVGIDNGQYTLKVCDVPVLTHAKNAEACFADNIEQLPFQDFENKKDGSGQLNLIKIACDEIKSE